MKLNGNRQEHSRCLLNIIPPGEELLELMIFNDCPALSFLTGVPVRLEEGGGRGENCGEKGVRHVTLGVVSLSKECWC